MALRIMVGDDHLDLPVGCTLQLDRTNPIINDLGSMTQALTVPATPHNLQLLGYPTRLDVAHRSDVFDGILADGVFMRAVKINVISAGPDGIDINLGTDESCLYDAWSDVRLRDIPDLPVYRPEGGVEYLVELMQQAYEQTVDLDYYLFPVALEYADDEDGERATLVNAVQNTSDGIVLVSARRVLPVSISSDDTITVPKWYGITPFLRVGRALHILFDAYGYTLADTIFDTDPQLSRLVMLNNTADAICAGYLDYADLMPDCTINDLLDALKAHFGAFFVVDSDSMTARCVLIKDVLTSSADADLTAIHTERPRITMDQPRQLVLSSQQGYDLTETECDDIDAFLDRYQPYIDTNVNNQAVRGVPSMLHDAFTQAVYARAEGAGRYTRLTSFCWPWNKHDDGIDEETISASDKMVPLFAGQQYSMKALPLYLSGVRNAHTAVKTSGSIASDDSAEQTTDLALCFAAGELSSTSGYYFGTPYCRQPSGARIGDSQNGYWQYSLLYVGEDGAYNRFWKEYDRILRYASRTIEVGLRMTPAQMTSLDIASVKTLMGQPMLIDTLSHPIPMGSGFCTQAVLHTLKPLTPCPAIAVNDVTKPTAYWRKNTNYDTVKGQLLTSIHQWLSATYDNYEIVNVTYKSAEHDVNNDLRMPTSQQVASGATITTTYGLLATVTYKYKNTGILHWETGSSTRSATADVTEELAAVAY